MSDNGQGQKVSDDDILSYMFGHRVVTATDVAGGVDVTRRTALRRLKSLRDRGKVKSKKVGAKGTVWWPSTDNGEESPLTDMELADTDTDNTEPLTVNVELERPVAGKVRQLSDETGFNPEELIKQFVWQEVKEL